jgi:hypothetical protein
MATLTGAGGSVTLADGPSINIFEWSADVRRDIFDDSNFNDAKNARTKMGGMADLAGSCRGTMKSGTTPTFGSMATEHTPPTAAFYLEADNANNTNYKFAANLTNMTIEVRKTDRIIVSVSFQSSGAVAVGQA